MKLDHHEVEERIAQDIETLGNEYTGFCWYCGFVLLDEPRKNKRSHAGIKCRECGTSWVRAYSTSCPIDGEESGGFVHLGQPAVVEVNPKGENVVLRAVGQCWCDCCGEPFMYHWEIRNEGHSNSDYLDIVIDQGDPFVAIVQIGGPGYDAVGGAARDVIESDS